MTDKLAALIRGMSEKHIRGEAMEGGKFLCDSPDCGSYWPCDAIRAVEVIEDLATSAKAALENCPLAEHRLLAEALSRAEEKLAR